MSPLSLAASADTAQPPFGRPSDLRCRRLKPRHVPEVVAFLRRLVAAGDADLFHPHPFTHAAVAAVASPDCRDVYVVVTAGRQGPVVAYGMLRGWEEGFAVPSLGIAVDREWRGIGVGRRLVERLHAIAASRGAASVRLKVYRSNTPAVELYRSFGYQLQPHSPDEWLGVFTLPMRHARTTRRPHEGSLCGSTALPRQPPRSVRQIPVSAPDLTGKEVEYVAQAVQSGWVSSTGVFVDRFEREFAATCETSHALSCSSGTTALHLAVATLGARRGDEVIVPSTTFMATANAVRACGATPVFVDVDPHTWCLDPSCVAAAVTPRTRGILPVHLLGHPADMDAINAIAADHGLWVVEDAAEAPFARYRGRPVGSLGDAAAFSFFGNKILTSGEGGAVTFSRDSLEKRMRMLRSHGMDPDRRYHFPVVGFNYRMSNLTAALACGQLERWAELVARRRSIEKIYAEMLGGVSGLACRRDAEWADPAPWLFAVLVNQHAFGADRDGLAAALAARGVETRPMFSPLHVMPPYRRSAARRKVARPNAERLGATGLMLPVHPLMTEDDAVYVCDAVVAAGRGRRPGRAA